MRKRKKKKLSPETTDTLIGAGSVFEGRIHSEASLHIEGKVTGDIDCLGDVTIGEGAHARSDISARHVTVSGTVLGNVNINGVLLITATGKLRGNVTAQSMIIEEGGVFEGQSRMHASVDGDGYDEESADDSGTTGS